ncbi:hypothetical protein ABXJ56_15560 [Microbacterium chocolatum]|uniref:hypothetical protein n=1 Tax=Microbacterium aurantiacum TaxID=162393 RepID=UPI00338D9B25
MWIELRHPQPGDRSILDQTIVARDWSGLGQQLYDDSDHLMTGDADDETRVTSSLTPVLQEFVGETFPGVHWLSDGIETTDRAVDAWGMTCLPEAR